MLSQLIITNFAIIDHLEIQFKPGLNVLSGETGAGKSIIINAVNLILGGRASGDLIRTGADEARVEALYILPEISSVRGLLNEFGLPSGRDLVIKRHISREGRNSININGSMATLQMLSRLGITLMSISGQHEHQVLLKPENHLFLLDDFASLSEERLRVRALFEHFMRLKEERRDLERDIKEGEEKQELARFQRSEIEKADIKPGEDDLLEAEKKRLFHAEQLREIMTEAYGTLYEEKGSLLSKLSACIKRLAKGSEIDEGLKSIAKALESAKIEIEEAALELREKKKEIPSDPKRLEQLEDRLQLIRRLKQKYGATIEEIIHFKEKLSHLMTNLEDKREALKELHEKIANAEKEILDKALLLSHNRKEAARKFEETLKSELALLDMAGTRFEVRFYDEGDREPTLAVREDGIDRVEFMISPNVGEDLKPLSRIASGGELSRIMLALKTILARTSSVETIVFDEVDSGIGGATAAVVGEKIRSLARFHQILCITHLPQIASKGCTHFVVRKKVLKGRTGTVIAELGRKERVEEIARLLGAKTLSRKAIAHAKEMLS
ncbi:MAG: DNA repair protein RecN [Deltaproteobacteria bacterium]|nr:DNA repair protein RecN [Deltaproteobacteria bacterium]